jgi:hypothetical protein
MTSEQEFGTIAAMVEKIISQQVGKKTDYFITGKVIKVDAKNRCIYLEEFGDQAIPLVGFEYEVKYYDETTSGTVVRTAGVTMKMPKVRQKVLVAREMGTDRLPRCLGVILGTNWVFTEED